MSGPLQGLRILEFEGIGPAPYAAMLLADHGAEVLRIARPGAERGVLADTGGAVLHRGRPAISLNLKQPADRDIALGLAAVADGLIEGLRPGVMERLGLGPEPCQAQNPKLVYGRVTGWGQEGPLAAAPGHDINYIALAGVLGAMGPAGEVPVPPLNLVGDFGGGGLWLAFGMAMALLEAARTGRGQLVDAAMIDGAASQTAMLHAWRASGAWSDERGTNLLDGSAPFYRCYACADGLHVAVGALEPRFYAALLTGVGLDPAEWEQADRSRWPALAERLAAAFAALPRDVWVERLDGTEACVSPVLSPAEAPNHPQNRVRRVFGGVPVQPMPGPRLSNHDGGLPETDSRLDADREATLARWGVATADAPARGA